MKPTTAPARAALGSLLAFLLCLAAALSAVHGARAQRAEAEATAASTSQDERVALHQALLDLSNSWTVMCVAAHPDDEDGATLTLLRRKYGVHTVTLFSTYGEGGQNATGPELYEELGAIRARETLAAARIQGSEPWFLALRDFGFSKSAAEAFRVWGHDEALRRMVLKIRALHPDVIITNHDTLSGHGHHQATGRLVLEAFDAAADARRFPEQLREPGVTLWQPQRLFVRVNYEEGTGSRDLELAAERAGKVITINPNERDAVRGSTYAEQALAALHQHASQGPWPQAVPEKGAPLIRYRLAREAKGAAPLPGHAQTFLEGLQLPQAIASRLATVKIEEPSPTDALNLREQLFDTLGAAREAGRLSGDFTEKNREPHLRLMNERLNSALAALSGITATLAARETTLVPNDAGHFSLDITNDGSRAAIIRTIYFRERLGERRLKVPAQLAPHSKVSVKADTFILPGEESNVPRSAHLYDGRLFGREFDATVNLVVNGKSFSLPVATRVDIAPAVEISRITPSPLVLTPATVEKSATITLRLVNHQSAPFEGQITAGAPDLDRMKPRVVLVESLGRDAKGFRLSANETRDVKLKLAGQSFISDSVRGGKHLPTKFLTLTLMRNFAREAPITTQKIPVAYSDARVPANLRVGYVRSFDDTLRDALAALGVEAKELTIDDVRSGELKNFDTIIIDNRGYQAHPELIAVNDRLLDFARNGGALIVCYHKASEWNPDEKKQRPQLAPFPIKLGASRVTDETAPVTFAEPQSRLLHAPNEITKEDFDGWIQERGLYYPKEWDAHYSAPFAASDAGEATLRGGLLAADYGRGHYIYTSMVWYRQLRAGVPGAYRLFANIISYGH
ncbi:MAG TPA: PIG-L family deacetylase [Pyrinomonadaceae bacterium]